MLKESNEFCCLHEKYHGDCTIESIAEWSNPDWLLKNCYYCGKIVQENHRSMNAVRYYPDLQDRKGEQLHTVQRTHDGCMRKEEQEIIGNHDWERGERYSKRHCMPNPLGFKTFECKCGCIVDLFCDVDWRKKGENEYVKFGSQYMSKYCFKHNILVRWYYKLTKMSSVDSLLFHLDIDNGNFQSPKIVKEMQQYKEKLFARHKQQKVKNVD